MESGVRERFERKVERIPGVDCWLWTASVNDCGYGVFQLGSRTTGGKRHFAAHRVSYELHIGKIPEGLCVLHKCDVPGCVNPEHLFLGTQKDNSDDKMRKGRFPIPSREKNGRAKLTWDQVAAIRKDPRKHREIAADYGISFSHVSKLKLNRLWKESAA